MPNARSTEVYPLGVINLIGNNLADRYSVRSILKELVQNADDARARTVIVGWTSAPPGNPSHELLQGPALFILNDGKFTELDANAIIRFGQNYKFGEKSVIGKFGLGLKSVFHLCEAFFYLSSNPPDDDGLFNNLASPWAKTDYDRGWNDIHVHDLRLLHDFLRPICSPLGADWFALWLPLRRNEYCKVARFGPRNDGDLSRCPSELLGDLSERGIARSLPLLHSIETIQIWHDASAPSPAIGIQLPSNAGRSLFKDYVTYIDAIEQQGGVPTCFNNYYEENQRCCVNHYEMAESAVASRVIYALAQSWSAELLDLTKQSDWPKSFVLSGGQTADKAQPHAAVVLSRRPERTDGTLDVSLAVFLPMEGENASESKRHAPECEFLLTLHGCFFVDSGRNAPYVGQGVRGDWNRLLACDGMLPLLIPSIEALAESNACDSASIRRLTGALSKWLDSPEPATSLVGEARERACRTKSWACRWSSDGLRWQVLDSATTVLLIPDPGQDTTLPNRALPNLGLIAREYVLTPTGYPRLAMKEAGVWDDAVFAQAISISDPVPLVEDNGLGLEYLSKLLKQEPQLGPIAIDALIRTLRGIFTSLRESALDEHKELVLRIVTRVPGSRRRALPLGGNWPNEIRRAVCAVESNILLLPDGFEAKDDVGAAPIPTHVATKVLQVLAGSTTPGRNTNPAAAVLRASEARQDVIEATVGLHLWTGQRLIASRSEWVVYSATDLRAAHDRCSVFIGPVNDWLRDLAAAVAADVIVLSREVGEALFASEALPQGDMKGSHALLSQGHILRRVSERMDLLRRLVANSPSDEAKHKWRWVVRYLLHGDSELPPDLDLFLASESKGVWDKLAEAALRASGGANRVLPSNESAQLLSSEHRTDLGIRTLDSDGIGQLLRSADSRSLALEFDEQERDDILSGLYRFPDLICELPLHDLQGGGLGRACANSYWMDSCPPGTLAQHIVLLKPHQNAVLRAIQKEAHPQELTPVELVRLAVKHGLVKHVEVVLDVFAGYGKMFREDEDKIAALKSQLEVTPWLPLQAGGRVSPADVLHDEKLGGAIADALRHVQRDPGDPVPSAEVSSEVLKHVGFREVARQLFPSRERTVSRIAQILKRDARFAIGDVDLRNPEERASWLNAFRDAPNDVMAASGLIASVDAIEPAVCVERLLPPLRAVTINEERIERILNFLRDRHDRGVGRASAVLDTHNEYLYLAATHREVFARILPRLRLLSETGKWVAPDHLCDASGVDPEHTLCSEQQEYLHECIAQQPVIRDCLVGSSEEPSSANRIGDVSFDESAARLSEYFKHWRDSETSAGWAGAFLSLLGDYEPIQKLAGEFLGIASPGLTVWTVRTKAGMQDVPSYRGEKLSQLMDRQRVLVRFTDPSRPMAFVNLLGGRITVNARAEFDNLLFGMDWVDSPSSDGLRVLGLHLRLVEPGSSSRSKLREWVKQTGEIVLRDFFGLLESKFAEVLDDFSGDDDFGVRVAQESFLNGAQYALPFLGLLYTTNKDVHNLLKLADRAATRRAEESAMPDKHLPGQMATAKEREFREKLQVLIGTDAEVQNEFVAAVRRKVQESRYEPRSVLFELFQNADDACAEMGKQTASPAIFAFQWDGEALRVAHNGRPINRCFGSEQTEGYLHDLRKMLSLGHSDKASGPAAGEVTGRFGLGFKSVFLIADRPRVASGRLAFEILGGVYPKPLEHDLAKKLRGRIEAVGMSEETGTLFELHVRSDVDLQKVVDPFRKLAHLLVVFGRRIHAIQSNENTTSWFERTVLTTDQSEVVVGDLLPLPGVDLDIGQAVVVRCAAYGDIVFGWGESGFVRFPEDIPSIWVTAPTTEHHDVGYLVNARLDLDVGRSQVTWDSATNSERIRGLGYAAGNALVALFDAGTKCLSKSLSPDAVWKSLWHVLSKRHKREDLHPHLMWDVEYGAARRLFSDRPALPSGLEAAEYQNLTRLSAVRGAICGVFDAKAAVFAQVAEWETFRRDHPPGSIVSKRQVGDYLPLQITKVDLASVICAELKCGFVEPGQAARLGRVFTRENLRTWRGLGDELNAVEQALTVARFRNATGDWVEPEPLVSIASGGDEALRAAFAPADRVLADDYRRESIEFFLLCRGAMAADTAELVVWVLRADSNEQRNAALQYLERGELGAPVRRELARRGVRGTWLANLSKDQMAKAGLTENEQSVIAAGLGRTFAPPPPLHEFRPEETFEEIADWWSKEGERKLQEYNESVYPDGQLPNVQQGGLGLGTGERVKWLKLFVTGIVQTIGRVTPDQNRAFIRLCSTERWFETLANPVDGPREWLADVERYIDRHHADGIRYFHWLRHFIGVATVARHLDAYIASFQSIDQFEGRFTPSDVLTTRASRQFQFGGPEAPTLVPILGIGSCFVLRELVRMEVVNREDIHPYCFAPVGRLRRFLKRLGWRDEEDYSVHDRSRSILKFIVEHHPDDATFGCTFDIPLLMFVKERPELFGGEL